MFMKGSMSSLILIELCQLSLYTLVSLFIYYNVVMLSEENDVDKFGLWFVKVLTVAAFIVLNFIGWTTTLSEKNLNN